MGNSFIDRGIIILFILHFFSFTSQGQESEEGNSENHIAIVVNGNVGSVTPYPFSNLPEDADATMQLRPYLGIQLNRTLSPHFYLKFSALYSNKSVSFNASLENQPYNGYIEQDVNGTVIGGYIEDAYFTGESKGYYKLQYLETNISLATKLTAKGAVYFGVYLAFLIEGENEITVDGTISHAPDIPPISSRFERTVDYSDNINRTDFGLQLGLERKIYKRFNANIQFSSSLHSLYNSDLEAVDYKMLNMFVAFGFTYFLRDNVLK